MKEKPDVRRTIEALRKLNKMPPNNFTGVEIAVITSINPTKIKVNGIEIDSGFIYKSPLCEKFETEVFKHKHTYNVKHHHLYDDHDTGEGAGGSRTDVSTSEEMTEDRETSEELKSVVVWRGLKVGDEVLVLRTNKSQKYILLCRVSPLDDRSE